MKPSGTGRQKPEGSRVEQAYRHLKMAIMSGKLPAGSPVNEIEIAQELGISRTPMREAIRQLERDGLVVRFPNRGVFVRQLEMKDLLEIWQIREWLEGHAAEVAVETIDERPLKEIQAAFVALQERGAGLEEYETHHQLDLRLHTLILEATGNATLKSLLDTVNARIVHMRMVHRPLRLQASIAEHLDIIAALLARDPARAAAAMRRHLKSRRENLSLL